MFQTKALAGILQVSCNIWQIHPTQTASYEMSLLSKNCFPWFLKSPALSHRLAGCATHVFPGWTRKTCSPFVASSSHPGQRMWRPVHIHNLPFCLRQSKSFHLNRISAFTFVLFAKKKLWEEEMRKRFLLCSTRQHGDSFTSVVWIGVRWTVDLNLQGIPPRLQPLPRNSCQDQCWGSHHLIKSYPCRCHSHLLQPDARRTGSALRTIFQLILLPGWLPVDEIYVILDASHPGDIRSSCQFVSINHVSKDSRNTKCAPTTESPVWTKNCRKAFSTEKGPCDSPVFIPQSDQVEKFKAEQKALWGNLD